MEAIDDGFDMGVARVWSVWGRVPRAVRGAAKGVFIGRSVAEAPGAVGGDGGEYSTQVRHKYEGCVDCIKWIESFDVIQAYNNPNPNPNNTNTNTTTPSC